MWILKDSGWGLLSSIPRCLAPPLILGKDWDYLSWLEHDADNTKVVSLIPEGAIHLQAGLESLFLLIICESVLSLYSSMQDEKNSIRTLLHISSGEEKGSCFNIDFLPAKCLEIPAWMQNLDLTIHYLLYYILKSFYETRSLMPSHVSPEVFHLTLFSNFIEIC